MKCIELSKLGCSKIQDLSFRHHFNVTLDHEGELAYRYLRLVFLKGLYLVQEHEAITLLEVSLKILKEALKLSVVDQVIILQFIVQALFQQVLHYDMRRDFHIIQHHLERFDEVVHVDVWNCGVLLLLKPGLLAYLTGHISTLIHHLLIVHL